MVVQAQQLVTPWQQKGLPLPKNFIVGDETYYLPSKLEVENKIIPAYWAWMNSLKLTRWAHKWDCDNFADSFKTFAAGYYFHNIESNAEGIGAGIIHFMANKRAENPSSGGAHAINILYMQEEGRAYFQFLEPQNGVIFDLTPDEFNSIWFVYL